MGGLNDFVEVVGVKNQTVTRDSSGDGVFTIEVVKSECGFYNQGLVEDEDESSTISSCSSNSSIVSDKHGLGPDEVKKIEIKYQTSFWGTIFNLVFLSAGSPVLLIPGSFVSVGLVNGSVAMSIIFVLYVYKMCTLLRAARDMCKLKRVSCMTYSDLVYESFDCGPFFVRPLASASRLFINLIFILEWGGSCLLICTLMAHNLQTICSTWLPFNLTIQSVVLIMFIPLVGLNLIRRLKFLQPCSTAGFSFTLISVVLVIYYSAMDSSSWAQHFDTGSIAHMPSFIGILISNINITGLIVSLKNEMKRPEKFEAPNGVLTIAYAIIFLMYFVLSIFFYFKYGADVPENATDVVPKNMLLSLFTLVSNVTGLYLSFPLTLYVPLDVIWNNLIGERTKSIPHRTMWEYLLRSFMVTLIAFVAYINLDFTFIVSLFGTVFASLDTILFPAIIESLVEWKVGEKGAKSVVIWVKNLMFLFFGVFVMLIGILNCVSRV